MKAEIIKHIEALLAEKIEVIESAIEVAKESRNEEGKSSAGDKFETGREMMQLEIDKLELQLNKTQLLEDEVKTLNPKRKNPDVDFGSLVKSNFETYYISVGLGKLEVNGQIIYAISLASPIGMALKGKKVGDKIQFQNREIELLEVS